MELCSILCGSLDGMGIWKRMDTCACIADSFAIHLKLTTLLIGFTPKQNKRLKKKDLWKSVSKSSLSGPWLDAAHPLWGVLSDGGVWRGWVPTAAALDPHTEPHVTTEPHTRQDWRPGTSVWALLLMGELTCQKTNAVFLLRKKNSIHLSVSWCKGKSVRL